MGTSAYFRLVRPVPVNDARLTSTNVPEALVAAYAGGTTYAASAIAGVTSGTVQTVYISLQAANTGHTPASSPTWWKQIAVVYAPYNAGTTYALGDIVSNIGTDVHELYKSVVGSNTGNALTDTTKWQALGSTNAHAMFDATYGSQTECADSITGVLTMGELTNTVIFGNLDAVSVTLTQSVSGWSRTKMLNSHLVDNWYDWFYEDIVTTRDVAFTDIPPYAGSTLTYTINNPGSVAKCGLCVLGKEAVLGETQWDYIASKISYSNTTTDGFGRTKFVKRPGAKRLELEVDIFEGYEDEAYRILDEYSDMPLVVIASTDKALAMIYCSIGNFKVPVSNSGKKAPIELKGLT